MKDEIERRKYLEKKVQAYVRVLCHQNQKCKEFLEDNFEDEDGSIAEFLDGLKLESQTEAQSPKMTTEKI